MKKKTVLIVLLAVVLIIPVIGHALTPSAASDYQMPTAVIDATGNFFTQPVDTRGVVITDKRSELVASGYELMVSSNELELYCRKDTFGLAVYDLLSGYTWYSDYAKSDSLPQPLTGVVAARIASGVTIEYYDANAGTITAATLSLTEAAAKAQTVYRPIAGGFAADIDFTAVGIKFTVEVTLNASDLAVKVPRDSIEEYEVDRLMRLVNYQLKSIMLFPYFGGENHDVNGYALIPDGSGALIKYTDIPSATAYIKRIHGPDYGLTTPAVTNLHLKPTTPPGLPVFGIAHGYNQVAFLAEITAGAGAAEIHSYPYLYNNIPINTTFFKFITRDTFRLEVSSGEAITLLNEEPYPYDYAMRYRFLRDEAANYAGMAQAYRESLGLKRNNAGGEMPLRLVILGHDYKPGLFGKNYQTMTTFPQALSIVQSLEENEVSAFQISYLGWNRGGYFNNSRNAYKIARRLGKLDFLTDYITERGYEIDYTLNPLISSRYGFGTKTVKKINLAPFATAQTSSLDATAYYLTPEVLADTIKKRNEYYQKNNFTAFNIDNLTAAFSYRYQNKVIYREAMVNAVAAELAALEQYTVNTSNPGAYLWPYLTNYYQAPYQSHKYIYVTDSVPFIPMILSGYINMYAPDVNYLSDYRLAALRMIEYNLYPSFIVTAAPAHRLRYTNFEYLLSTEYRLWENLIVATYHTVNGALRHGRGARMVEHYYPAPGVARVAYDNGTVVYVNYNNAAYGGPDGLVPAGDYLVISGDSV